MKEGQRPRQELALDVGGRALKQPERRLTEQDPPEEIQIERIVRRERAEERDEANDDIDEQAPRADEPKWSDNESEGEFSENSFDEQDLEESKSGPTSAVSVSRVGERGASRPDATKKDK